MDTGDREDLIQREIEHAERTDLPTGVPPTRRGNARSRVYSIRLNDYEWQRVQDRAAELGIPAATLVRSWVLDGLDARHPKLILNMGNAKSIGRRVVAERNRVA